MVTFTGHADIVRCCCYSPDGSRIVSCSDDTLVKVCGDVLSNISNMRRSVSSLDETPRRELKIRRIGVFLTKFEVFHLVMKHCVECLIFLLKQNRF